MFTVNVNIINDIDKLGPVNDLDNLDPVNLKSMGKNCPMKGF